MALKSNYNEGRIAKDTQRQVDLIYEKTLNSFIMAGEQFIIDAREQGQDHELGQYKDVTTNLRNSIGYFIFHDGQLVHEKNEVGTNRAIVQEFVNPKGFQMILIAGMNYASFVESKGYNVISYQADLCLVNLAVDLEKLEVIGQGSAARMEETFLP